MEASLVARLEAAVRKLEKLGGGGGGDDGDIPAHVADYDDFCKAELAAFISACEAIDEGKQPAAWTKTVFDFQRNVLLAVAQCKKPKQMEFQKFLQPIIDVVTAAQDCDKREPDFAHRKAYAEFIQFANWLLMPNPAGIVANTLDAADFYLMKILTSARGLDDASKKDAQRAYVNTMKAVIKAFSQYVKDNFKMGLTWKPNGIPLSEFKAGGGGAASAPAAPPAAPAAPAIDLGALDLGSAEEKKGDAAPGGMGAVFSELNKIGAGANKGMAAALGLKKVTKDMKSKNNKAPALKPKAKPRAAAPKKRATEVKREPTLNLRKGTWFAEHYGEGLLVIDDIQMKQNLYLYNCSNCTVQIPEKCKSIQVDKCKKIRIFFKRVVSVFEVINSTSVQIFIEEACPSVTVDKSSGINVIVQQGAANDFPTIVYESSSELNVTVPPPSGNDEDDPIEMPILTQFQATLTKHNDNTFTVDSAPIKHSG